MIFHLYLVSLGVVAKLIVPFSVELRRLFSLHLHEAGAKRFFSSETVALKSFLYRSVWSEMRHTRSDYRAIIERQSDTHKNPYLWVSDIPLYNRSINARKIVRKFVRCKSFPLSHNNLFSSLRDL